MKVFGDKTVTFNRTDVDKFLMFELERKQFFIEEHTEDLIDKKLNVKDVELFSENTTPDKVKQLMIQLIFEYLEDLIIHQKGNITLRKTYQQLQDKELELGLTNQEDGYEWFNSFSHHLITLEKYLRKSVTSLQDDTTYTPRSPKVVSLLRTYDEKRTKERLSQNTTHTSWEKMFKRFFRNKLNLKRISEELEERNEHSIRVCFTLMNKTYLEGLTQQDIRKLCDNIYRVPLRWDGKLKEGQTLSDVLNSGKKCISRKTVKLHLITLKDFLRYCVREQVISNSFNDVVELPVKLEKSPRNPFTTSELKKIFNPTNYPNCKLRDNQSKFWIPLVSLFQGCRLNEICQLDVGDIVVEKGLECISINGNSKDKSVKNSSSERIIPIHPVLKDLGFLDFVGFQQRNKQEKLFPELVFTKDHGYGRRIQRWFGHYLDKLGIKGRDKVFHSFRHTFETCCLEKMLHTEHQNRLCGWSNRGVGQKVYGKHLDIHILYNELCKIEYPIKKELKGLKELYSNCYVMKLSK